MIYCEYSLVPCDWQLNMYGGAMHGFTHRRAVPGGAPGVAYDARAEERSFTATRAFLAEVFAECARQQQGREAR